MFGRFSSYVYTYTSAVTNWRWARRTRESNACWRSVRGTECGGYRVVVVRSGLRRSVALVRKSAYVERIYTVLAVGNIKRCRRCRLLTSYFFPSLTPSLPSLTPLPSLSLSLAITLSIHNTLLFSYDRLEFNIIISIQYYTITRHYNINVY